jgi:hypothetical protein
MERVCIGRWPRILQITFIDPSSGGPPTRPRTIGGGAEQAHGRPAANVGGPRDHGPRSIETNGERRMLAGFFKLMTLPVWILFWGIARLFKARAVVRSGRRVYPVRVKR